MLETAQFSQRFNAVAVVIALGGLLAASPAACADEVAAAASPKFRQIRAAEARSPDLCHARPDRAYVTHKYGTSCMAYFVTKGQDGMRRAIVFIDGDISGDRYARRAEADGSNEVIRTKAQRLADRFKVRVVVISRMGIDGSSGDHGQRRRPVELMAVNETLDVLKKRLGLDDVVLAGQSGGSTISASILTLGRKDVACAVLGSGAFSLNEMLANSARAKGRNVDQAKLERSVHDPMRNLGSVHRDGKRRIFVLGDAEDQRTPFAQQKAFAAALAARGHSVEVHDVRAGGPLRHGVTDYTLAVAALCAIDAPNERIRKGLEKHRARIIARDAKSKASLVAGFGQ